MPFDDHPYLSIVCGYPLNPPLIAPAVRPSACPGLLRIVPALDGGICRIKLAGGAITAQQAIALAVAAEHYAAGVIEATNRGNLQIRGIGTQQAPLIQALLAAGLGPKTAAGDDVRNLMLSPGAGIDPQMLVDTRPLAARILATLEEHEPFHQLSAKFAVQLDGGEALAMREHPHDLWLAARVYDGEPCWVFGLAGCPAHDRPVARVTFDDAHALVVAVLEGFLERASPTQTRMRQLLAELPLEDFIQALAKRVPLLPAFEDQPQAVSSTAPIGTYPQGQADRVAIGAAPVLSRLDANQLKGVAQLAMKHGDGSLRFTPWQGLLLPGIHSSAAALVTSGLQALGLLCDARQPLAQLIACTGSNGCGKGLSDSKRDALQLAARLSRPLNIHLSGCPRSCAAAYCAPFTLLAVAPGYYDLYFRDEQHAGFGVLHARNLTIEAAGALLDARPRSSTDD